MAVPSPRIKLPFKSLTRCAIGHLAFAVPHSLLPVPLVDAAARVVELAVPRHEPLAVVALVRTPVRELRLPVPFARPVPPQPHVLHVVGELVRAAAVHAPALPRPVVAVEAVVAEGVGHEQRLGEAGGAELPHRKPDVFVGGAKLLPRAQFLLLLAQAVVVCHAERLLLRLGRLQLHGERDLKVRALPPRFVGHVPLPPVAVKVAPLHQFLVRQVAHPSVPPMPSPFPRQAFRGIKIGEELQVPRRDACFSEQLLVRHDPVSESI
mmetsp:Transcript_21058/g.41737  ORF Transcript_21058/g.41737 Transcript_21058/m.41737 type:complete len:265 (-) Transcript_21058:473-1267(-)